MSEKRAEALRELEQALRRVLELGFLDLDAEVQAAINVHLEAGARIGFVISMAPLQLECNILAGAGIMNLFTIAIGSEPRPRLLN